MSSESLLDCAVQAESETAAGLPQKESESDPVEINPPLTSNTPGETNLEEEDQIGASGHVVHDLNATDTSEFEDLLDGSGVNGPTLQGVGNTFFTIPSSSQGDELEEKEERSSDNDLLDKPTSTSGPFATPRQLSITGRAALRKCFTENNFINLPVSQPVIALSERQMHTVLRTISDESLLSSYHLMKSLLLQAADRKVISKERCRHVRRAGTPGPGQQSSTEGASSEGEYTSGSYTSGAINSDDDPGSLDFLVEHDCPRTRAIAKIHRKQAPPNPPRKRQRVTGRPGKVMKESYFKGIKWTKTFVTGLLDPILNRHDICCQICKFNASIRSKGAR